MEYIDCVGQFGCFGRFGHFSDLKNLEILTTLAVFVIMAAWLRPFGRRPADLQIYFKFSIGSHLDIPGYLDILLVFSFQIPPGEDCPDAFLGELDRGTQLKNLTIFL